MSFQGSARARSLSISKSHGGSLGSGHSSMMFAFMIYAIPMPALPSRRISPCRLLASSSGIRVPSLPSVMLISTQKSWWLLLGKWVGDYPRCSSEIREDVRPVVLHMLIRTYRPPTNSFVGHINAAFDQKLFNISKAKIEPEVHPNGATNDVRMKAMTRICLLYTSPSPRDKRQSRMPSSA